MAYTDELNGMYHTSGSVGAATGAIDYSILFKMSTYAQIERQDGQNLIQSALETKINLLEIKLLNLADNAKLPMPDKIVATARRMLDNHLASITRNEHTPGTPFTKRNFNTNILDKVDKVDPEKLLRQATLSVLSKPFREQIKTNPSALERQAFRGAISWLESRDWTPVPLNTIPFLVRDTLKRSRAAVVQIPDNGMLSSVSASVGAATGAVRPGFAVKVSSFTDAARDNRELKQGLLRFKVFSKKEDLALRVAKIIKNSGIRPMQAITDRALGMLEKQFNAIDRDHRSPSLNFEARTWRLSVTEALETINPKEISRKAAIYVFSHKLEQDAKLSQNPAKREAATLAMTWLDFQENDKIALRLIPMHIERTYLRAEKEVLANRSESTPFTDNVFS